MSTKVLGGYVLSDNPTHRRIRRYKDQHGRMWWCQYDKRAGGPVGAIEPDGWTAPFLPAQQYILPDDDDNSLTIDYDTMLVDIRRARRAWFQEVAKQANDLNLPVPAEGDPVNPKIMERVGPAPHADTPWRACKAGNLFALGRSETVDIRLKPFLPLPPERVQVQDDAEDWSAVQTKAKASAGQGG